MFGVSFSYSKLWAWLMTSANSPAQLSKVPPTPLRLLLHITWQMYSSGWETEKDLFSQFSNQSIPLTAPFFIS